ncbi:MAG: hypothetical protein GWM90_05015 [Gemmatimonadetes bacterium]|nr:hypothetical protein [Gemmatimonadota bacterium]NIQ53086.1 hypothetical protein [Gemmatimonadota bacterium]NIU73234.1 hypothetical protein [Gammaproteobacteria bacterium]NIX43501.1 hypothetical protein [Gemmatimonadota bacterium]NIY07680.1 hypothetical protein [Gemmatimonadota bacterium]
MNPAIRSAPALAAAGILAAGPVGGQTSTESGTFILVQDGRVVATETFSRSADRLETILEVVSQVRMATTATLGEAATVERLEVRVYPTGRQDGEPLQTSAAVLRGEELRLEEPIGTPAGPPRAIPRATLPYLDPSPSHTEQILRRARAVGGDTATIQVWMPGPGGGRVVGARVRFEGTAATLHLDGVRMDIETDDRGRLLAATVPGQQISIIREPR